MGVLSQTREIVLLNLRSIPSRLGASLVIVIGIAGVVAVLVAMLAMSRGLSRTLEDTGAPDRVVVLRGGSTVELSSFLDRASSTLVRQDPGVARLPSSLPAASGEVVVITEVMRPGQSSGANVSLRGVEPSGLALRPELRLVEGRMFRPGLREIIVGSGARSQFANLDPGSMLRFRGTDWRVVGVFASGDAHDSELWADLETVQGVFRRNGVSSVLLKLANADSFDAVKARLTSDPQLNVEVQREGEYFRSQSAGLTRQIGVVTTLVGIVMALGAMFGAINTMYSAVSTRTAEIGTLRALGFGRLPVLASVMAESLLLALAGGLLGAGIAAVLFNGYTVSTLGSGFTQIAFDFAVTPDLLFKGLSWALGIGFVGGLAPALHAARIPVTEALRAR
ncbi:MAG: ABC transporter permease [Xanthomonadales bacterium]|nr:ABC transporter permease [Xanthomonadales bacterium]MBP6078468.1 ABC transporter permease [Xanthomonadales bacterium]MBP7622670.1 ABC transporter permease [Xanthomonadales bacterium]